jgi:hypothetical protein
MPEPIQDAAQVKSFMDELETLLDPRANRGQRHQLPFVWAGVSLAILVGRTKVSGLHRNSPNRLDG